MFHVEHCTYNHGQPGQRKSWTTRTCSQKERGREEDDRPRRAAYLTSQKLGGDKRFQGNAVRNHKRRAGLLDEMLLFEAREKPADGLAGRADHLPDLFVSQSQLHLAGVLGGGVLVEPSD